MFWCFVFSYSIACLKSTKEFLGKHWAKCKLHWPAYTETTEQVLGFPKGVGRDVFILPNTEQYIMRVNF